MFKRGGIYRHKYFIDVDMCVIKHVNMPQWFQDAVKLYVSWTVQRNHDAHLGSSKDYVTVEMADFESWKRVGTDQILSYGEGS